MSTPLRRKSDPKLGTGHYATIICDRDLFKRKLIDPIAKELVETAAFQRLKGISFLGAISYQKEFGAKAKMPGETRYDHSLGVARIAEKFSNRQSLVEEDRRLLIAAALLHDIGHPPLSHSAESAFAEILGETHHSMTERIILGREKFAKDVPAILFDHRVDPYDLLALLNGRVKVRGLDLFKGPFNLDTLEGISRCSTYMAGRVNVSAPSPSMVLEAAIDPFDSLNVGALDGFWRLKNSVYNELIRSPMGVAADKIASDYVLRFRARFDRSILTSTDNELLSKHERLFRDLHGLSYHRDSTQRSIQYVRRNFVVDESLPATSLAGRYTYSEVRETFSY